jgi:TonB family protein
MDAALRLRAVTAVSAVAALLVLACRKQPADRVAAPPSPSASTSASVAVPRASSSSAPSASATASAVAKPSPDPPPRGKPGGHLASEVIQRVVRQGFGHFRLCYESTLRNSPNLQNRVTVQFVIDVDGTVKKPRDGGSETPDAALRTCVVEAFRALQFPPPEGGTVTVTYPILFSPGG